MGVFTTPIYTFIRKENNMKTQTISLFVTPQIEVSTAEASRLSAEELINQLEENVELFITKNVCQIRAGYRIPSDGCDVSSVNSPINSIQLNNSETDRERLDAITDLPEGYKDAILKIWGSECTVKCQRVIEREDAAYRKANPVITAEDASNLACDECLVVENGDIVKKKVEVKTAKPEDVPSAKTDTGGFVLEADPEPTPYPVTDVQRDTNLDMEKEVISNETTSENGTTDPGTSKSE